MKRPSLLALASFILVLQIGCNGGGSSSGSYTTQVEIVLGRAQTVSPETGAQIKASDQIPSSVSQIRFTISAPDMQTITRSVPVAGRTTITESFEVPVGASRRFLVESLDPEGNIIFRGEAVANVGAEPLFLTISLVNTDPLPPAFSGLSPITGITVDTLVLNWSPATDNVTDPGKIQYLIYSATSPSGENFANPTFASSPGATSYTVTNLTPSTTYYFVVRAMDEHGNVDGNSVERSTTTLSVDPLPPLFSGLSSITGITADTLVLNWSPATDNVTDPGKIQYLIYVATSPSAENFANPTFTSSPGATSYTVTNLSPATTYYFVARARDEHGNVDGNSVERSATTRDPFPPVFSGLSLITGITADTLVLNWSPATDNVTDPGRIQYLIYAATSPSAENFANPTFTSSPGATSYTVTNLSPATTYYFVVRARDEQGNVDGNSVERSATTLSNVDTAPPSFGGLEQAVQSVFGNGISVILSWTAATDNVTPQSGIVYRIYRATAPGAENFSSPSYVTAPGQTGYSLFLPAGGTAPISYYFVVRAVDEAGNEETNTVERLAASPGI